LLDFGLASCLGVGAEFAEAAGDVGGFVVDAFDFVILTTALDGGPFDDAGGGGTEGIAHVRLLEDFFGASSSFAIGDELLRGEMFILGAVDRVEEAEFDGIGEGDAEIQVPG